MLIFSFIAEIIPLDQRGFVEMTVPINIYIVYTTSERELLTNFMDPNFLENLFGPKFFGPKFFGHKFLKPNFLDPYFLELNFLNPNFLDPFLDPNFLSQFFGPKYFETETFLGLQFFWTLNILNIKILLNQISFSMKAFCVHNFL